jgi:hypothetical protein
MSSAIHPVVALAAGILISSVHAVKSTAVRPAVTATTGGIGNVPVSMAEDILATITSIFAIVIPIIFAISFHLIIILAGLVVLRRSARIEPSQAI